MGSHSCGTNRGIETSDLIYDASGYDYDAPTTCTLGAASGIPPHSPGKERDAESGNDYFGARYYASSMGRFPSPDWSAKIEPVPYAKLGNPQTLNLYAYVGNRPLGTVDEDGHGWDEFDLLQNGIQNQKDNQAATAAARQAQAQQQNVPMSKSTYKSATGAATAALDAVIGQSEKTGWEYARRIVKLANGKYAYTSPTTEQSSTASDPDGGMKEGTRIPTGTTDAGMYHTHPTSCAYCAHDQFSGADNATAVREQLPSYIESGATRSIYMLPVRPSILDPTPPVAIRYGPPQ